MANFFKQEADLMVLFELLAKKHEPVWTKWEKSEFREAMLEGREREVLGDMGYILAEEAPNQIRRRVEKLIDFGLFEDIWIRSVRRSAVVDASDEFFNLLEKVAVECELLQKEET